MSIPEPTEQDEIFERLRRGEIDLKQAYKLLQKLEAERGVVEPLPGSPGKEGLSSRLSALFARLKPAGAQRPQLRVVPPPRQAAEEEPGPQSRGRAAALEIGTISVFLLVLAALAGPILFTPGYAPGFDVPSHMYVTQRLAEGLKTVGRLPTMDPYWYSGLEITHKLPPLTYIPMVVLYLFTNSAMLASRIFYFLALGAMGLVMYTVVRLSGGGRLNGLGAAIVVPFSMASVSYDNGVLLSYTRYFAFLLFPIAIYSAKRLVEGRLIQTVLLAVVISLMFPIHPMIGLIAAMWIGVYAFCRIVFERRPILTFRYFIYAYALAAFLAFWYIGPFVTEETVWGTSIPHETLVENSTNIIWQAVHFEAALAILVVAALVFRFSMERLALFIAAIFGFVYAWGAYGPILKIFPQLQFAYPFLAFFASVIGLTYMVFTSANLSEIKGTGRTVELKRVGAGALVMALVAAVVAQNWLHDPFTRYHVSNFSREELEVTSRLRRDPSKGRVVPLGEPYGLIVHAIPLKGKKRSAEGQYTTIAPFYLEISQIYDNLLKGYPDTALEKLRRWDANYVLIAPTLKQRPDFQGRNLQELLRTGGYRRTLTNRSWTMYQSDRPARTVQGIPGNTLVIGRFSPVVLALFPVAIAAQESVNIDDYSLDELSTFKTLVVTGFTFKNKAAAEKLLKAYVRRGGKLVVDMQSVDEAALGKDQKFLGVKVNQGKLSGKVSWEINPDSAFNPAPLKPVDFGPDWRSVYYSGLTETLLTAKSSGQSLPVLGYKSLPGGRAYFIGGNLLFFAFDKHNPIVAGAMQNLFKNLETEKPPGSLKVETSVDSPEKVVFKYQADAPWPALVSRTFTPHWRAVLDGRRALKPMKLEGLTGLDLPKGDHEVTLYYGKTQIHPVSYAVSAVALVVAAALFVFYRRRDRLAAGDQGPA